MNNQISKDAELIDSLGGAAKVAELLNFPKNIGIQRVHNWKTRGIPARVRLDHRELFDTPSQIKAEA